MRGEALPGVLMAVMIAILALTPLASAALQGQQVPRLPQPRLYGFRYEGQVSGNTTVVGALYVPLRNVNLLYYYAEEVNTPGSPMYRHYLSRQEVEELFYPVSQFEQALAYVRSRGLRVLFTAADSVIVFEGSAGQVEKAFNLTIGLYSNGSLTYYEALGGGRFNVYVSNLTALIFDRPSFLVTLSEAAGVRSSSGDYNISFPETAYLLTQVVNAYNVSPLYSSGYYGQGVSVGIIDFYGDPTLAQDLAYYDVLLGLPPANLTVVPIGPYDPNLGVLTGWSYEIELDVEAVHTVAPRAHIVLYAADGALPLSSIIAFVDQQDDVSVVSQSFGIPESLFSYYGLQLYYYNVYLSDIYYALGAAEGITFVAASGDGGGMGYSAGPLGDVNYPASSPWVLAVGGTTTYVSGNETLQTAWSSAGFVPYMQNDGGSTGGYSAFEPMPWWQAGVAPSPPAGFPDGRAVPDVAANANIFPGAVFVGEGNQTFIGGGTSESNQLVAGLLALVESATGQRLGLVAPTLYYLYAHGGASAFEPITFGYNIPWTASPGFNLVTGLGAINAGELAELLEGLGPGQGLTVKVLGPGGSYFINSTNITVKAEVSLNGANVTEGNFTAEVVGMYGLEAESNMYYNASAGLWESQVSLPPNASGPAYILVKGEYMNYSGLAFTSAFLGYFGDIPSPTPLYPYDPQLGIPLAAYPTSITGAPPGVTYYLELMMYVPMNNSYVDVISINASSSSISTNLSLEPGYYALVARGTVYGMTEFYVGSMMQLFLVLPPVLVMPGATYPGGYIYVEGLPVPPVEALSFVSSQTGLDLFTSMMYGSNVTASLVSGGVTYASSYVPLTDQGFYSGFLYVPPYAPTGLYWVMLRSSYNSTTLSSIVGGLGVDMMYVAQPLSAQVFVVPPVAQPGDRLTIEARITYPNGTPVKFGVFSATLVPSSLEGLYENISQEAEVPLAFNSSLGAWVGSAYLPGPEGAGNATYYEAPVTSGQWLVIVSGESAFGNALPYAVARVSEGRTAYYSGLNLTPPFDSNGAEFNNVTISLFDGNITWSYFTGNNELYRSDAYIGFSDIEGTLVVYDSHVTLSYATAAKVILINSSLTLRYSTVGSLVLKDGSVYTSEYSTIGNVYESVYTGLNRLYQASQRVATSPMVTSVPVPSKAPTPQPARTSAGPSLGRGWSQQYVSLAVAATALALLALAVTLALRRSR